MLASLTAFATSKVAAYAGMGVAGVATTFILKKIPNNTIKAKFGSWMYSLGVVCTLGMGKWKWTKNVWNKTIEPYFVDAIDNILVTGISKFVEGLRSDNAS
tara:strand:- start:23252 stop:23554 length:303 start_codon:yes stop_codon:yes gene_type:complete